MYFRENMTTASSGYSSGAHSAYTRHTSAYGSGADRNQVYIVYKSIPRLLQCCGYSTQVVAAHGSGGGGSGSISRHSLQLHSATAYGSFRFRVRNLVVILSTRCPSVCSSALVVVVIHVCFKVIQRHGKYI